MADATIGIAPDGTGKLIDAASMLNGASLAVYRQTVTLGDPSLIGAVQSVKAGSTASVLGDAAAVVVTRSDSLINTKDAGYTPIAGSGQYGVSLASVTALTVPAGALYASLQIIGGTAFYTTDGTAPTTSRGMEISSGAGLFLAGAAVLAAIRLISAAGTMNVEYYK